jgi:hypothetical protein
MIDKAEFEESRIRQQELDLWQMKFVELAARLQAVEARTLALELDRDQAEHKIASLEHWRESARARLDCLSTKEQ